MGAADSTRLRYLPIVKRFIADYSGQGVPDWTGLSVQRVTNQHQGVSAIAKATDLSR